MIKKKIRKTVLEILSKREKEVIKLLLEGKKTVQIAKLLNVKPNTISTIKKNIFYKLEIRTLIELYNIAILN